MRNDSQPSEIPRDFVASGSTTATVAPPSLLEAVRTEFRDSVTPSAERILAAEMGTVPAHLPDVLGAASTTIYAGLVQLASTASGQQALAQFLKRTESGATPSNLNLEHQAQPKSGLASVGPQEIFGNRYGGILNALGHATEVGRSALGPLLDLLTPAVVGFVGQQMRARAFTPQQTIEFLQTQAAPLREALPPELMKLLSGPSTQFEPPHDEVIQAREKPTQPIPLGSVPVTQPDLSDAGITLRRAYTWPMISVAVFTLFLLVFLIRSCGVLSLAPQAEAAGQPPVLEKQSE